MISYFKNNSAVIHFPTIFRLVLKLYDIFASLCKQSCQFTR
jgi:hypothetical protein